MSIYQLYLSLSTNNTFELTKDTSDFFLKNVKNLDEKGQEMIYILIKTFEMENNQVVEAFKLPFEGSGIPPKEIKFDLDNFPENLKKIIFKFLNIHLKNMDEEQKIKKERENINIIVK
jgi:hypothetical protein